MSTESPESRRLTRFPEVGPERPQEPQKPNNLQDGKKIGNRGTRFPGSLNHDFTLLTAPKLEEPAPERRNPKPTLPRIPLAVNTGKATPRRSIVIDQVGLSLLPMIRHEDPWLKYTWCYRYDEKTMLVSEYAQVSLRQTIAIPYDFEQAHVSEVCNQVFEGMLYLSGHGFSHKSLDSSKVLLQSDGNVKIAYIESCQETGFTPARGLGLLVLEMIQKGVIQESIQEGGKLEPSLPILWSAELINFLEITSHCSLSDIKMNTFLKSISPTILIPFISYAQLEAIAPQIKSSLA
ncbi:hypothetical protein V495_00396 [Pseudogymnoascus sp. VKM F-4514 (FW-929)]|nr:hypothetical protein V495_00396 [Pseudogymnoascus sp. VKM F-4514 (FW-929)]KFY66738.1 hypothetical protein V497_00758 [Pseudogymnoascus sp. VKM F-4516 (FW-969)]